MKIRLHICPRCGFYSCRRQGRLCRGCRRIVRRRAMRRIFRRR